MEICENTDTKILKPFYRIQTCASLCSPRVVLVCSCNDTIRCHYCRKKRFRRNQKIIERKLNAMEASKKPFQDLKLLTLTLSRTANGLKHDLDKLSKAFEALRRRSFWKKNVTHWIAVKEVVEGNVHLHIVILSKFWKQSSLANDWKELTGNFIVDIRPVKLKKAKSALSIYLVKDSDPEVKAELALLRDKHKKMRFLMSSHSTLPLLVNKAINEHQFCENCKCLVGYSHKFRNFEDAYEWVLNLQNKKGT